ncbi:MAG: DUF2079 domain-containing protein [Aggregatilineales bacterium]
MTSYLAHGLKTARKFTPPQRGYLIVLALILLYAITFIIFTIVRYERYNATGWDLGIFTQLTWNASRGLFLQNTLAENNNMLAVHAPYITILLAPLMWSWPDPRTLLVAQTAILAFGAWPIARIASRHFQAWWMPVVFATLWLLYPALGWINRFDFHEIAPAATFFAFAFEACDRRAWRQVDFWLILAILCKEEVGLNDAFFGLYMLLCCGRSRRAGITWFVAGIAWFTIHAFVVFPTLRQAANGLPIHAARYEWLLSGNLNTIISYVLSPDTLIKIGFLFKLFAPVAFIALGAPLALIPALPTFALSLLSSYEPQFDIFMHYTAVIIPCVIVAAIYGTARLHQWLAPRMRYSLPTLAYALLLGVFLCWWTYNPLFFTPPNLAIYGWEAGADIAALNEVAALIPPQACVVASNEIEPHYSVRPETYVLGARGDMDGCAYMIVDLNDRRHNDFTDNEEVACYQFWSGKRAPIYYKDSVVVLLQKPANAQPTAAQQMQSFCDAYTKSQTVS